MSHLNIASYLEKMAELQPDKHAIVCPSGRDSKGMVTYIHYTYRELLQESTDIAKGLEKTGIGRGVRTVLMVKPSLDFFALTFGIFKAGAVPVMIDPGIGLLNIKKCLAQAEPRAFIGIPEAHIARVILGWAKKSNRINVHVGKRLVPGGKTLEQIRQTGQSVKHWEMPMTDADETAAILFTSGSTGVPKGAVYTHRNFISQVDMIKRTFNIQPGETDLPTFPLFALFDPALGMTTIIPDMDFTRPGSVNPLNIIEPIRHFSVTNMFGSPALINRVGRYGAEHDIKLESLKRIISAGAPVPAPVLEKFSTMVRPDTEIFTPYGATEAMPVASIGSHEILEDTRHKADKGHGVCVGRPVEGMEVRIVRISDDPIQIMSDQIVLQPGLKGEITVKGAPVTREYYKLETHTNLAKIHDQDSEGFWHRMGDIGYFDEQGRIWFCGRKSHRVVTDSSTMFTVCCEGVFNTHQKVFRTALVGVKKNNHIIPVLCVELEQEFRNSDKDIIKKELLDIGAAYEHTRDIKDILFHESFPVDIRHNAKIFREKLAVWAQKKL